MGKKSSGENFPNYPKAHARRIFIFDIQSVDIRAKQQEWISSTTTDLHRLNAVETAFWTAFRADLDKRYPLENGQTALTTEKAKARAAEEEAAQALAASQLSEMRV